jgi:MOSC domain-containing protein YiiM
LAAIERSRGFILQINVSKGGVPKTPITEAQVGELGILGDGHRIRFHGGRDKALLLMAAEVIDALKSEGWPVFYGALGENLTTSRLEHNRWRPGQQFRCGGDVVIELTEPREPCATLNCYGKGIQRRLSRSPGEAGFYAAVANPGKLLPRDIIEIVERIS